MKRTKKKERIIKAGSCGSRMSLPAYAELLPMVEVQHTFYQPPQIATLERWRASMPEEFEFTLKAWQLITHTSRSPTYKRLRRKLTPEEMAGCGEFRDTPIVREAWEVTRACAAALGARVVLLQCPASFTPTEEHVENLRGFLGTIDRGALELAWEPRGDWPAELVGEICEEHDLIHTVDPFKVPTVTPERPYFRLHGRTGYRYQYEEFELEELLEMMPEEGRGYILFNNVKMLEDAARMQRLIERAE